MKKLFPVIAGIMLMSTVAAQQIPISESYFLDKYSFAPSYAGNFNPGFLFAGYRSDWSGIPDGPRTLRFSFNNRLMENAGYGGKIIYDKAGIFKQLYALGSYSYRLNVSDDHKLMFGLSAGVYHNSLNMAEYYNDPEYSIDPSLVGLDVKSKIKFMSDFSLAWSWKGLEAGAMFSNISFGDATYEDVDVKYKPLANFQFHTSYNWQAADDWDVTPLLILRGGKYILSQFEVATRVMYSETVWVSLLFRDPGIWGAGAGAAIGKGLRIAYNFNFSSGVELGALNNHEVCLGINLFEYLGKK
jgi:type IX secretion system PorP/SprF family membrane protein